MFAIFRYDFSNVDIQLNTKTNIVNQSIFINDIILSILMKQLNELNLSSASTSIQAQQSQQQAQQQQQSSTSSDVTLLPKKETEFIQDELFEHHQQHQQHIEEQVPISNIK